MGLQGVRKITTTTAETAEEAAPVIAQEELLSSPVPLGTEADVYCYGYIGHPDEPMPNRISSFEDVEVLYLPGAQQQSAGAVGCPAGKPARSAMWRAPRQGRLARVGQHVVRQARTVAHCRDDSASAVRNTGSLASSR